VTWPIDDVLDDLNEHHGTPCVCGGAGSSRDHQTLVLHNLITTVQHHTTTVLARWVQQRATMLASHATRPHVDPVVVHGHAQTAQTIADGLAQLGHTAPEQSQVTNHTPPPTG